MRTVLAVVLASALAACREQPDPAGAPSAAPAEAPAATRLVAPMQTRARLLDDLSDEQRRAREREAAFDELTNRDR